MTTIEELQAQINSLLPQLASLEKSDSNINTLYSKENDRIERYLSDLTNRQGLLLTISSLFSFLPILDNSNMMSYFLIWIYPFLIIAILMYILSAKRINFVSKVGERLFTSEEEINELVKKNYFRVIKFHRLTDSVLIIFFSSFVINYYFLVFFGVPIIQKSVLILLLVILLGILRYSYISRVEGKKKYKDAIPTGNMPQDAFK